MRLLLAFMGLYAFPAYAHHEVVAVASVLPALGGAIIVYTIAVAAIRKKLRKTKRQR